MAVVEFRLGSNGDKMILAAQELEIEWLEETGMRENDGDGTIENPVLIQYLGTVGYCNVLSALGVSPAVLDDCQDC